MILIEEHIVPEGVTAIRLVDYAPKVFKRVPSRSALKKAIKRGEVLIDGNQAHGSRWIIPGQNSKLLSLPAIHQKYLNCRLKLFLKMIIWLLLTNLPEYQ